MKKEKNYPQKCPAGEGSLGRKNKSAAPAKKYANDKTDVTSDVEVVATEDFTSRCTNSGLELQPTGGDDYSTYLPSGVDDSLFSTRKYHNKHAKEFVKILRTVAA